MLKLLEKGLRDPNIPVTFQILSATTRLQTILVHGVRQKGDPAPSMLEPGEDPRAREIREAYVAELAAGLAKRTGESQTTTAVTILTSVPPNSKSVTPGMREAQRILVEKFDTLHPYTQEWLLRVYWDLLRDSALTPALKKMLAAADPTSKNVRESALQRLVEMAPDEARSYVVAEIREPRSTVDPKFLSTLEDKSLPEVDAPLLEQIRRATQSTDNRDRIFLKFKVDLLVRYATDSIYQDLMELYRNIGQKLQLESRAALLAYFAKHNEEQAMPLIEQAVSEIKPGEYSGLLSDLTKHHYSESISTILKKFLETDDYAHASNAAYLLGKHGAAGDERILEARLKRWREEWKDRIAEANAQYQGQVERELIYALVNGTSWKLSPERVQQLKRSCLTQICKQSNLTP